MAFQTATSTSIDNLMAQLNTFLVANGWVQDHFTAGDPGLDATVLRLAFFGDVHFGNNLDARQESRL